MKINMYEFYIITLVYFMSYSLSYSETEQKHKISQIKIIARIVTTNSSVILREQYGIGECSTDKNCYLPYGICLNKTTCMCMSDYADFKEDKPYSSSKFCQYKRKSLVIAGLLELFLPFALGHFYAGHINIAIIKLLFNIIIYILGCSLHCKDSLKDEEVFLNLVILCILLTLLIPLWNIIDLLLFFTGKYNDGHGITLS